MRNGGMGAENLVKEATELLEIADLSSSAFSWSSTSSLEVQLDRSSYNGVCQQVVELKILLLQLRRLLDWTNAGISQDGFTANTTHIVDENELLRERLKDLQREVIEKDERIKRLEKILETGKKDVSQLQVPQSRPHSLQDVSIQSRTQADKIDADVPLAICVNLGRLMFCVRQAWNIAIKPGEICNFATQMEK
eukprot:GFUD01065798.1.p1 GENE.GFUD01065798.1~~GFUD01065798.1.p1  ORF type:complete len:194 (+),score=51.22 GFUD01065798.1:385-966(+)